ncbi:MAG: hypothetical protein HKN27_03065 [Silicimonas sp.]|nr:hypothetical protein [Silicimonas sp.]
MKKAKPHLFSPKADGEWLKNLQESLPSIQERQREFLASLPDPLLPPWKQYPDLPAGSMGWKMGAGEDYVMHFMRWFADLPKARQVEYVSENPPPKHWYWIYDRSSLA